LEVLSGTSNVESPLARIEIELRGLHLTYVSVFREQLRPFDGFATDKLEDGRGL
jgi:hypothetical protein